METFTYSPRPKSKPHRPTRRRWIPWSRVAWTALPIGLAVYYLTLVAPSLVPLAPNIDVPYPQLTRTLEPFCAWCGAHPEIVAAVGLALLIPVALSEIWPQRIHVWTIILVTFGLSATYLSISAPVDRLITSFDAAISSYERVPPPEAR